MKRAFRQRLLAWYGREHRKLPWRETRDPYRVWVSEIMLQQTRVAAVVPYYEKFLERFPDAGALAAAQERELLACWSGLGYYSRARNMREAAKSIAGMGGFPRNYAAIRQLKGVGDYTAAAVASIAFDLPHAAVDGNVLRVLARVANDTGDLRSAATRNRLRAGAEELLDRRSPGTFNQALMELGATVCLPKQPRCAACPVSRFCEARMHGRQNELPVKPRRRAPVRVERTLLVIEKEGRVLMKQRAENESKLAGFWELPAAEEIPRARFLKERGNFRHSITNHDYRIRVVDAVVKRTPRGFQWLPKEWFGNIPLATIAKKALAVKWPH